MIYLLVVAGVLMFWIYAALSNLMRGHSQLNALAWTIALAAVVIVVLSVWR